MSQIAETLIVIGAGLPRTGTTSMKIALEILLNQPCYHMAEIVTKRHCDILKWQSLIDEANKSHGTSVDYRLFKEIFHGYAAVTDAPACGFCKHLMNIYPNSKVVLTLRDKNDWLSSLRETVLPKTNTPQKLMFDEMKTTFGLDKTFEKMVYDSMKFAFQKDIDLDNDEALLECFDEYNQRIKDTIPHERLLVHTFTDGWGPLCKFLNVDIPKDKPYPHVNDRNEMKSRMEVTRKQMS